MTDSTPADRSLTVRGLVAGYPGVEVLHGVDLEVRAGQLTALIGANGAGKSTLLGSVMGTVGIKSGTIEFAGERLGGRVRRAVDAKVALVPQGRRIFARRTVADNLLIGGWTAEVGKAELAARQQEMYARFPILGERSEQPAGSLSGGEAQMLAIGMALMPAPRLLLLDEPSLGLAPIVVDRVMAEVRELADQGMAVLIVEQVVHKVLKVADHGYVLQAGRVVADGPAAELRANAAIADAYLGR